MSGERRPLLCANWKMNPVTRADAVELARGVAPAALESASRVDVTLFPPYPWLVPVATAIDGTGIGLGAQDCHWERSGAFTGEVSAAMVATLCGWVITGHSERRAMFGDTDEVVARKTAAALEAGLTVVACVGETLEQHEAGETEAVVDAQLGAILRAVVGCDPERLVVAYEPVWAIGTGRNATPEHAGTTMAVVRRRLDKALGEEGRILYGGSVNAVNVASYVALDVCDGCLVGGASLKREEFSTMIGAVSE